MTILITGSRSLTDQLLIDQACDTFILESFRRRLIGDGVKYKVLKHGAAAGVDTLAAKWAERHGIETVPFPAKWDDWEGLPPEKVNLKRNRFGKYYNAFAGFNRNQKMLDSGFDVLLAIRCLGKSNGCDDMIERVKKTGKPIFLYKENSEYEWLQ